MYSIPRLYVVHKNSIELFATSDITPAEFQAKAEFNTTLYISLTQGTKTVGINFSRLITDNPIGLRGTWADIALAFNDELVLGYTEDIPGYVPGTITPKNQVVSWDVLGTLGTFSTNYADSLSEKEGLFAFRYNLKDLRVSCVKGADPKPNLKNCAMLVNGFMCRPVYREDKQALYGLGGAQLCWQFGKHSTPEVQFIDFSDLGDISIQNIYFSKMVVDKQDFALYCSGRTGEFDLDADWNLTSDYSLKEYTPIVVIGGIVILPDQYVVTGEYSFRISMHDIPVHRAIAYSRYLQGEPNSPAEIAYSTVTTKQYLEYAFTKQENLSPDCFVIMVKCPRIYVSRVALDVWRNGITINLFTEEGLVIHRATGTIRTYESATYSDRRELTIQNLEELYVADHLRSDTQIITVPSDSRRQKLRNIQQSNCEMLYLMG